LKEALKSQGNHPGENDAASWDVDTDIIKESVAKALAEERERERREEIPRRMREELPEFDQICSEENGDYIEFHNPRLARTISSLLQGPKTFQTMKDIYEMVKEAVPNATAKEREKIKANALTPKSSWQEGIQGATQGGVARVLTEADRDRNYRRMQEIMRCPNG